MHDLCQHVFALARNHESWPGGESRKRDLNRRLAVGAQVSPGPPSSLRFNPAGFAARQDTNAPAPQAARISGDLLP